MARALIPGYRRLSGSTRSYEAPSGQTISYRQYRNIVEAEGAVRRLDALALANRRQSQRTTNDIIRQMANVRGRAIEREIESLEGQIDAGFIDEGDVEEIIEELREERRTIKSRVIKSPSRKEALADLKRYSKARHAAMRGHRPMGFDEQELGKRALTALGRREDIPDWVPVGASDKFRQGQLQRGAPMGGTRYANTIRGRA